MVKSFRESVPFRNAVAFFVLLFCIFAFCRPFSFCAPSIPPNLAVSEQPALVFRSLAVDNSNKILRLPVFSTSSGPICRKSCLEEEAGRLTQYFLTGLNAPSGNLWVNLSPREPGRVVGPELNGTEAGRVMLDADIQLKKDFAAFISPYTNRGSNFWVRVRIKSGELFGAWETQIPLEIRLWIEPSEVVIKEGDEGAFIEKAVLKVSFEPVFGPGTDSRVILFGNYVCGLLSPSVSEELTAAVNSAPRYCRLRQVFNSLVLAQWFKQRSASRKEYNELAARGVLSGLVSGARWSAQDYFRQYEKLARNHSADFSSISFLSTGEIRVISGFSGGVSFALPAFPPPGTVVLPFTAGALTVKPASGDENDKLCKAVVEASIKKGAPGGVPELGITVHPLPDRTPADTEKLFVYVHPAASDGGKSGTGIDSTAADNTVGRSGISRQKYLERLLRSWAGILDANEGKELRASIRNDILNISSQCITIMPFIPERAASKAESLASDIRLIVDLLRETVRRIDYCVVLADEGERRAVAAEREELLVAIEYFAEYEYALNFVVNIPKIEPYRFKREGRFWRVCETTVRRAFLFEYGLRRSRRLLLEQTDKVIRLGNRLNRAYTGKEEYVREEWKKWISEQDSLRGGVKRAAGVKSKNSVQLGINRTWKTTGTTTRLVSLISVCLFLFVSVLDFGHILAGIPLFLLKLGLVGMSFFISWYSIAWVGFNDVWYKQRILELASFRNSEAARDFRKERIKYEIAQTINSFQREKRAPSVDYILVFCKPGMKKNVRLNPELLRDDVLLEITEADSGSGSVYTQACSDLLSGRYGPSFEKTARLKGRSVSDMRGIVIVLERFFSVSEMNGLLDKAVSGAALPAGWGSLNNLEMALLNGYKSTQEMGALGRSGMVFIFADNFLISPVTIKGDITLIGSWDSYRHIKDWGLGLLVADIGSGDKLVKLYEKSDTPRLYKKLRRSFLYTALDWENEDKTQMLGFNGMTIFSFKDPAQYRRFLGLMDEINTLISPVPGRYSFVPEIMVPLVMTGNGENPYTYLDTRFRNGEFSGGDHGREYKVRKDLINGIFAQRNTLRPEVKVCVGTNSLFFRPWNNSEQAGGIPGKKGGDNDVEDNFQGSLSYFADLLFGKRGRHLDEKARIEILNIVHRCVIRNPFTTECAADNPERMAADIYVLAELLKESINMLGEQSGSAGAREAEELLSDRGHLLAVLEYFLRYEYALNFVTNISKIEPYKFKRADPVSSRLSWLVRRLFSFETGLRKSQEKLYKQLDEVMEYGNLVNGLYSGREEDIRREWKEWVNRYSSLKREDGAAVPLSGQVSLSPDKCMKRFMHRQKVQLGVNRIWDSDRGIMSRLLSLLSLVLFAVLTIAPFIGAGSLSLFWGVVQSPGSFIAAFYASGDLAAFVLTSIRFCLGVIPLIFSWYNLSFVSVSDPWYESNMKLIAEFQHAGVEEHALKGGLSKEFNALVRTYEAEMSAPLPSADFLIVVGSGSPGSEKYFTGRGMPVRDKGVFLKYLSGGRGSGNAWLTAVKYLESDFMKEKGRSPRGLKGIIILADDIETPVRLPISLPQRMLKRSGRPLNNIDLAIFNGYQLTQQMALEGRDGLVVIYADSLLISPMRIDGDITVSGVWTDYEQLREQKPGLLIADLGNKGNRLRKIYEKADLYRVRDKIEKEAGPGAINWAEKERQQLLVFAGTVVISFKDNARYAGFLKMMAEAAAFSAPRGNEQDKLSFVSDIFIPLLMLINNENPYAYLDAVSLGQNREFVMNEGECALRRRIIRLFEKQRDILPGMVSVCAHPHGTYLRLDHSPFAGKRLAYLNACLRQETSGVPVLHSSLDSRALDTSMEKRIRTESKNDCRDKPVFRPASDAAGRAFAVPSAFPLSVDFLWNTDRLQNALRQRLDKEFLRGWSYQRAWNVLSLNSFEGYRRNVLSAGEVLGEEFEVFPQAENRLREDVFGRAIGYAVMDGGRAPDAFYSSVQPPRGGFAGPLVPYSGGPRSPEYMLQYGWADSGTGMFAEPGSGERAVLADRTGQEAYLFVSAPLMKPANRPKENEECVYNLWAKPKNGGEGFMLLGGIGGFSTLSDGLIEKALQALADAGKDASGFNFFLVSSCDPSSRIDVTPQLYASAGDGCFSRGDYKGALKYYDLCLDIYGKAGLPPSLYDRITAGKQRAGEMLKTEV